MKIDDRNQNVLNLLSLLFRNMDTRAVESFLRQKISARALINHQKNNEKRTMSSETFHFIKSVNSAQSTAQVSNNTPNILHCPEKPEENGIVEDDQDDTPKIQWLGDDEPQESDVDMANEMEEYGEYNITENEQEESKESQTAFVTTQDTE